MFVADTAAIDRLLATIATVWVYSVAPEDVGDAVFDVPINADHLAIAITDQRNGIVRWLLYCTKRLPGRVGRTGTQLTPDQARREIILWARLRHRSELAASSAWSAMVQPVEPATPSAAAAG